MSDNNPDTNSSQETTNAEIPANLIERLERLEAKVERLEEELKRLRQQGDSASFL